MVTHTTSSMGRMVAVTVVMIAVGLSLVPPLAAEPAEDAGTAPAAEKAAAPAGETAPAPKVDSKKCEHYVAVLGGEKDAAVAKEPEFRELAGRATDLVTCKAIRADSDEPCKLLEKDGADACRTTRATFHEMREYPNGRSYMFDDRKYQECKKDGGMPMVICDALRNALRTGDPSQCVMEADFVALCRQAVKAGNMDGVDAAGCATEGPVIRKMAEGQCRALVNLDPAACDVPGPHAEGMAEQCRKDIESRKSFGGGLKDLAKSGSGSEKEFAKAALEDADACKEPRKSAMDACLRGGSPPDEKIEGGGGERTAPGGPSNPPPAPEDATAPKG